MKNQHDLIRLNWMLMGGGVLSVGGILAAVWFYGLKPAVNATQQFTSRRVQLETFIRTEDALTQEYQAQRAILEKQRTATTERLSRVPARVRETEFMDLVSETARECRVTLSNFRPQSNPTEGPIETSQIRISGSGSYEDVVEFLSRLRQLPRMNRVARLEVSTLGANREVCSIEMTLDLFFNALPLPT